ncbi:hypothetical protein [Promicromonospora sukumoe]|uniref:hypothetical protein n=1 Tax=Promicromonospora sukumoe TaxID=88382 RepID=UPI0012FC7719|nr:hypothetical protein [Promicromonospora sukumoe]
MRQTSAEPIDDLVQVLRREPRRGLISMEGDVDPVGPPAVEVDASKKRFSDLVAVVSA